MDVTPNYGSDKYKSLNLTTLQISASDTEIEFLITHFLEVYNFETALKTVNCKILLHCKAGSRSYKLQNPAD